jgi:chitinase
MFRGLKGWPMLAGLLLAALPWGCLPPVAEPTGDALPADGSADQVADRNHRPVADAGEDQTVAAGATVLLDGSGSADADNDQLSFFWQQVDGEPQVELEGGFSSRARFEALEVSAETMLTFRLTVVDGTWASVDEVRVTICPTP